MLAGWYARTEGKIPFPQPLDYSFSPDSRRLVHATKGYLAWTFVNYLSDKLVSGLLRASLTDNLFPESPRLCCG